MPDLPLGAANRGTKGITKISAGGISAGPKFTERFRFRNDRLPALKLGSGSFQELKHRQRMKAQKASSKSAQMKSEFATGPNACQPLQLGEGLCQGGVEASTNSNLTPPAPFRRRSCASISKKVWCSPLYCVEGRLRVCNQLCQLLCCSGSSGIALLA